jgi:hypothetical protein
VDTRSGLFGPRWYYSQRAFERDFPAATRERPVAMWEVVTRSGLFGPRWYFSQRAFERDFPAATTERPVAMWEVVTRRWSL